MLHGRAYAFSTLAVVTVLALPAGGQSVISARSGVIHFFEGAVYLADQPLDPHFGRFPCMAEGAELRTAQGRAEVLLTPGVFLRVGENSAIRMLGSALSDTRVELLAGSALVDAAELNTGTSVTLAYQDWNVHFRQKGTYRIDAEPPRLWVQRGEADVSAGGNGALVSVEQGTYLPFAPVLVPERFTDAPGDALTDWANGRSQSISADNAIAAQIDGDPASMYSGSGVDGFTYFPFIGVLSPGSAFSSGYGSFNTYQPGFYSIYLPGYTYRPIFVGSTPGGLRSYPYTLPRHVGVSPIVPPSHGPVVLHPVPVRPMPRGGGVVGHGGVHR